MARLSTREYWDSVHDGEGKDFDARRSASQTNESDAPGGVKRRVKSSIKKLLGARRLAYMADYSEYILWNVILDKYIARQGKLKVLEVGSAPGEFLVKMRDRFGCAPYGVEYSENGARLNREVFAAHGIDPQNVIEADFFADDFQNRYQNFFDIVVSRGFVEHFSDLEDVIAKHANVLAAGGQLIVSIPNLRGVNYSLTRFFHRELIEIHNLRIMDRKIFSSAFAANNLSQQMCDYFGTFSFYLFNTKPDSYTRRVLQACMKAQPLLNALFRGVLGNKGAENRFTSPHLIYVGLKK